MVRLINHKNTEKIGILLKLYFNIQRHFTFIENINYTNMKPCIYALWHSDQFGLFGLEHKDKINVLISNSADGEIIANAVEMLGFKTVRGSTGKKGAVGATMQMLDKLKNNECAAIMVDGPRGPAKVVKGGVVKIAKMANVPIIPMGWYSSQPNFIHLPSWDKMTAPIGPVKLINVYGDPIYVPQDLPDSEDKIYMLKVQESLLDIDRKMPELFEEAKKAKLWNKRKK